MLVLKVPEGQFCNGCMFLEKDFGSRSATCMLFSVDLDLGRMFEERMDNDTDVYKDYRCPRDDDE